MALTDLIFREPTKVRIGASSSEQPLPSGAIEFDASITETHESQNEVTQFPVEQGTDIADHVRPSPDRITINGVVTNTPIVLLAGIRTEPKRAEEAYEKLRELQKIGAAFSVVTSLRIYDNMVIESFSVLRDVQNGNVINVTITLREIFTAEIGTVEAPIPEENQTGSSKAKNVGEQSKKTASPAEKISGARATVRYVFGV